MVQLETILILQEDLTTKQYESIAWDYKNIIEDLFKTHEIKTDLLGKKQLAYEIKSCRSGWYILFTYNIKTQELLPSHLSELERRLRIDDKVLKFITTKRSGDDIINIINNINKSKSEQNKNIDAIDVLLGLADYIH